MVRTKMARPKGNFPMELLRKSTHVFLGIVVVLLVQGGILDTDILGLATLLLAAVVLFNYSYEKELLYRLLSINRADAKIPGLDMLAYLFSMWIVLMIFPPNIAFASIFILAIGDPLAHLVSRGFGGINTMVSKDSYWYGIVAGTLGGTIAAMTFVPLLPALIASTVAMFVEAGEFRIADHHIDDNFTIPVVAALVLVVIL